MEKRQRRTRAYRAAVILHELLRSADAGHRTALRFVLRRSSWPALLAGLQVQPARAAQPRPSARAPSAARAASGIQNCRERNLHDANACRDNAELRSRP